MRIAFYAPMKAPDHPRPSGDRTVARLLVRVLEDLGHDVFTASSLRSWDAGDPRRQEEIAEEGARERERLIDRWRDHPPELWFTYHLHHKAPDHLGPAVADAFGIPYVVAEPSVSPKARHGRWCRTWPAALAAIERADVLLPVTCEDRDGLIAAGLPQVRIVPLKPFVDADVSTIDRCRARAALATRFGLAADRVIAIVVAMMRTGDKLKSYRVLGEALERLDRPGLQLLVVGDGLSKAEVEDLLAARAVFVGEMAEDEIHRIMAGCDLFLWPAVNEAYGMSILLAQARGLAVVAGNARGVGEIIEDGSTGILVPEGDAAAFARALAQLLDNPDRLDEMGAAACRHARRHHSFQAAGRTVARALALALESR